MVAIDGNKRRRGSLAWLGSCVCCALQGASQQGGRSPESLLKAEEGFSDGVLCVQGGLVVAARYVVAVPEGLLLTLVCFSLLQRHCWHCSLPLPRSSWWWRGQPDVQQRGGLRLGIWGLLQTELPSVLVSKGRQILCSAPTQTTPCQISCCVSRQ